MQLVCRHELVFVTATLTYRGSTIEIPDVLVDIGAASTVIDADHAANTGVYLEPSDRLRRLRGVGGHEHVFVRAWRHTGAWPTQLPGTLSPASSSTMSRAAATGACSTASAPSVTCSCLEAATELGDREGWQRYLGQRKRSGEVAEVQTTAKRRQRREK